jgi:hypothetical protein
VVFGHLFAEPKSLASTVAAASSGPPGRRRAATVARLIAPSTVPGWELDAARQLATYALTPGYQTYLEAVGVETRPREIAAALHQADSSRLVSLAADLLDRFCVFDPGSLLRTMGTAHENSMASVIFVAPYVRGTTVPAARYERAAVELLQTALN